MPLQRRIPKRGFTPRKRHVYQIVNVGDLARVEGTTVNAQTLRDAGLIRSVKGLIKLLAMGEVSQAYSVEAHKFSGGAAGKIEAAGGSVTTIGPVVRADPPAAAKENPAAAMVDAEPPPAEMDAAVADADAPAVADDVDPPTAATDADPPAVPDDADPPDVEDDADPAAEAAEAENDG
jgi:ribosomal protein L18E